jgi:ABC-type Fe3+ transport system permease subunit
MPLYFQCWTSFENIRGVLTPAILIYGIPVFIIVCIYIFIMRSIRQTNQIQQRRRRSNERDLLVIKRIVILILATVSIGLPSVCIFLIYLIGHYLNPFAHYVEGLCLIAGLLTATVCFAMTSPQIKKIFQRNQRQIHPIEMIENNKDRLTRTCQQQQIQEQS